MAQADIEHQGFLQPEFYERDHTEIAKAADELKSLEEELAAVYTRWEELEALE